MFIDGLKFASNQVSAALAYKALLELASDFLKESAKADGLDVKHYWRWALARAGEPRSDRKTIPIVGPIYTKENTKRLLSVLDYGLREKANPPEFLFTLAPQTKLWGAQPNIATLLSALKRMIITKTNAHPAQHQFGLLLDRISGPLRERTIRPSIPATTPTSRQPSNS